MSYSMLSVQSTQPSSCLLSEQQERPRVELQLEDLTLMLKIKYLVPFNTLVKRSSLLL